MFAMGHVGAKDAQVARLTKKQLVRFWRPFRIVAGFALLGVAVWVLTGKSSELAGAGAFLNQIRWEWIVLAAVAELGSYLGITFMERTLLGAGDVRSRLARLTAIAFSGSAIQSALPVGAAFAGVYEFRQFQLLGADEVLSGWVVIAVGAVAFATLAALAGVGLSMAATLGSTFDLVEAIVGVLFIALLAVLAWANRSTGYRLALRATARLEKALKRPAGQLSGPLGKGVHACAPSPPPASNGRRPCWPGRAAGCRTAPAWRSHLSPWAPPCPGPGCCWPTAAASWP